MEEKKRKTYRNFARSEKAIVRAYVELMQRKGESRITVTDIVNLADLNRSTFYAHFKTADDVREKIHNDIFEELLGFFNDGDFRNALSEPDKLMNYVLKFIKRDEELYKMLLNTVGASNLKEAVVEQFMNDKVILPHIKDKNEFEINLRMFIGGFTSVIEEWAAGKIDIPLEKCTQIMGNSIKTYVQEVTQNIS